MLAGGRPRRRIPAGTPVRHQPLAGLGGRGGGVDRSRLRQRRLCRPCRRGAPRRGRRRRARRRGEHPGGVGQRPDRYRQPTAGPRSGGVPDTAEPFDFFGSALAAGDFNNDTFIDLAIGVPGEDLATITDAGAVTVLYGSASGLSATGSQFFFQDTPGVLGSAEVEDGFGAALGVGDFNNDSSADLAIGAPSEGVGGAAQAGAVNVVYGSASGLTATGNQQWLQGSGGVGGVAEVGDQFGFALTSGDFNNDSFADLAIGTPFEDVGTVVDAGAINVLYGSAARLTATGNQQWLQGSGGIIGVAEESDFFGAALAAGDFNNDGFADLAIGAPFEDVGSVLDAGAINVLYGSANRLTATGNQQWLQGSGGIIGVAEDGDTFGFALAGGDFNNNGFDDLAIGAIGEDIGTIPDAGSVNVLYGSANRLTAPATSNSSKAAAAWSAPPKKATSSAPPSAPATTTTTPSPTSPSAPPSKTSAPSWTPAPSTPCTARPARSPPQAPSSSSKATGASPAPPKKATPSAAASHSTLCARVGTQHERRHHSNLPHRPLSWSFSRSFHKPQLHRTRPDSPETPPNLTWSDPTGP